MKKKNNDKSNVTGKATISVTTTTTVVAVIIETKKRAVGVYQYSYYIPTTPQRIERNICNTVVAATLSVFIFVG